MTQPTNPINWPRVISYLAAGLVALLALLAFVNSYSSLRELAQKNGGGEWLSYTWPLLLDFAMIVFSLAILRANLRGEGARYPWILTIAFSILAILANILDVATMGIPPVVIAAGVKALAPVALVLAFELLVGMVRAEVKRGGAVQAVEDLLAQVDALKQTEVEAQIRLALLDQEANEAQTRLDNLQAHQPKPVEVTPPDEPVKGPPPARGHPPEPVQPAPDIALRQALRQAQEGPQDVAERREQVLTLLGKGMTQAGIAEALGVGLSTVKRDIRELNGRVKAL